MHQRQLCIGDANHHPFLASFDSLSGIVNPVVISPWVTGRDIVGHGHHKMKVVWEAVQYREEVNSKVATHPKHQAKSTMRDLLPLFFSQ